MRDCYSNNLFCDQTICFLRDVLFQHFESPEEGTRNVVAECVGKLALVHPQTLLPKLQENLSVGSAFIRSTVVTALKYTISDQPQPIDTLLHTCIGEFLATIGDPDLVSRTTIGIITFDVDWLIFMYLICIIEC